MKIHIEYCVKWNYGPEFDRVSKQILDICPDAFIKGNEQGPRTGAFEVLLNGQLVFSKFSENRFPNKNEISDWLTK